MATDNGGQQKLRDLERRVTEVEGQMDRALDSLARLDERQIALGRTCGRIDRNVERMELRHREEAQHEKQTSAGEKAALFLASGAILAALIGAVAQLVG